LYCFEKKIKSNEVVGGVLQYAPYVCVYEAVSKACHPAPDAGTPEKRTLVFRGLRVKSAMTSTPQGAFETAPIFPQEGGKLKKVLLLLS
jgi:hypothetical protein